jgi:uncharacterized Zn-finger protein
MKERTMNTQHAPAAANAEVIETKDHVVACDGGTLGHPRVFLHIDDDSHKVVCPYCSRTYVYVGDAH